MGGRGIANAALTKDAPIKSSTRGYVIGMVQKSINNAAMKDATTMLSMEVYVLSMEHRKKNAVMKDAPTFRKEEVSVRNMEGINLAAVMRGART